MCAPHLIWPSFMSPLSYRTRLPCFDKRPNRSLPGPRSQQPGARSHGHDTVPNSIGDKLGFFL